MRISYQSLEILLDLIEIKMHSLQVQDRDDVRELTRLKKCQQELSSGIKQISLNRMRNSVDSSAQQERLEGSLA